ncbi:MAG: type II toxin-antitoxin system RelE/ParE family toxin [Candidatus Hydrogenedentes bacterium]|nr:type II toxin-antitoxin system RelE/ParE family toxin [Candidatus Hydrogenedentota bacterium]
MKVVWSPLAVQRACDAARYIAEEAPSAAEKWVDRLVDAVSSLESLPRRGFVGMTSTTRPNIHFALLPQITLRCGPGLG